MTKLEADDLHGVCRECKEWTTVGDACCGAPVECEGGTYDPTEVDDETGR